MFSYFYPIKTSEATPSSSIPSNTTEKILNIFSDYTNHIYRFHFRNQTELANRIKEKASSEPELLLEIIKQCKDTKGSIH